MGENRQPVEHDLICPECRSPMRLRESQFGLFYGCSRYPKCKATHGAHPTGEPFGIPAGPETRKWRIRAHEEFDKLWHGEHATMSRAQAYRWMIVNMALPADEAHIGRFSVDQCKRLIVALEHREEVDLLNGTHLPDPEVFKRRAKRRRRRMKR